MACMDASIPAFSPPHVWSGPAAFIMSSRMFPTTTFPTSRLSISPIPMGLTPGLPHLSAPLSSGINLHATNSLLIDLVLFQYGYVRVNRVWMCYLLMLYNHLIVK